MRKFSCWTNQLHGWFWHNEQMNNKTLVTSPDMLMCFDNWNVAPLSSICWYIHIHFTLCLQSVVCNILHLCGFNVSRLVDLLCSFFCSYWYFQDGNPASRWGGQNSEASRGQEGYCQFLLNMDVIIRQVVEWMISQSRLPWNSGLFCCKTLY